MEKGKDGGKLVVVSGLVAGVWERVVSVDLGGGGWQEAGEVVQLPFDSRETQARPEKRRAKHATHS